MGERGEAINFRLLFLIFHFITVIVERGMRLMQYSDCETSIEFTLASDSQLGAPRRSKPRQSKRKTLKMLDTLNLSLFALSNSNH